MRTMSGFDYDDFMAARDRQIFPHHEVIHYYEREES